MNLRTAALACVVVSLGCSRSHRGPQAGDSAAHEFRKTAPTAGPAANLQVPTPERFVLDNGLTVFVQPSGALPLVHARIVFRSGSAQDPDGLPGLAGFVGDMLTAGTATRTAVQIADDVEVLGTEVSVNVSEDSLSVSATSMERNFEPLFSIMADLVQNSTFSGKEIERIRKMRLATLARAHDQPGFLAEQAFRESVFDRHPYAHAVIGSGAGIRKMNRKNLVNYYQRNMRPKNGAVILTGAVTLEKAKSWVSANFSGWKAKKTRSAGKLASAKPKPARRIVIDRPGAPQTELRIGHLAVSRDHADYFPLLLCNAVLGGLFQSRINMNLRKDKGYTYGARSRFRFHRAAGPFVVSTAVQTEVTGPAIQEVLKEVKTIREDTITQDELDRARAGYVMSLPGRFESISSIASMVADTFAHQLPADFYRTFAANLNKVSLADVHRVAKAHLRPSDLSIVLVGDRAKIQEGWTKLGLGELETKTTKL